MTRQDLIEMPATLDGERAIVGGTMLDFARICRADGKGGTVEFAWETVEHIMVNKGGRFAS